jgi:hypothetical protein
MQPITPLTDNYAKTLETEWKRAFPDASILPVIGLPSYKGSGVVTITHTMGDNNLLKINGLPSHSPLANNALYSSELSNGIYLNLYEIMIPDIPGTNGQPSSAERYVAALRDNGLNVAGVHFHWFGATLGGGDRGVIAIHHQGEGMNPIEFTRRTINALRTVMPVQNYAPILSPVRY